MEWLDAQPIGQIRIPGGPGSLQIELIMWGMDEVELTRDYRIEYDFIGKPETFTKRGAEADEVKPNIRSRC